MDVQRTPPEPDAGLQPSRDAAPEPQALLERVIAQFPAAAAVYAGPQHVFRAVSAAYKQVIGGREVIGLPIREALPELDGQGFFELLDRVYRTGEPITMSGVPATWDAGGDGEAKPRRVDFTYQALLTPEGEIEGVIALVQDVSERHAAQSRDRVLARLGAEMSLLAGDERIALQHLADVAVSELADWVIVDVIGVDGRTAQRVAMAHADAAKAQIMRELVERYPPDPSQPTLAREALATGRAQLYNDVDEAFITSVARDAEQARLARLMGARSAMVVPLVTRAGPFGVVAFGSGRRAFTHEDLAVAEELGRRASLAVENARLIAAARHATEEAQLAAARTARLQTLSAALASALTPNDVAVTAVREAVAAVGADAGLLTLVSPDGTSLDVIEAAGYDAETIAAWRRFPLETNVPLADAVRTGEIVTLVSPDDRVRRYPHLDRRAVRYPASLSVPLMAEGRSFGALGLSFRAPITVLPEDRELLLAVARQCAQAVRRATLYDAEAVARASAEAAGRRLAFLANASAVLASLDYETALQRVARLAVPAFADYVAIDVVDDAGVLQRVSHAHVDSAGDAKLRAMARHHPRVGDAVHPQQTELRVDEPILVAEVTHDWLVRFTGNPEYADDAWALGPRSLIIAPLASRGRTLGAMTFVIADATRRYTATDASVAAEVARRAATAVDNARLYQQSEAARRDAEAASRAKGQFLAVMSHELRTPLNAILGYTELVEMGVHGAVTDAQREAMARIRRSGRHLLALVNNVLNLERAEVVGAVEPVLEPLPVAQLFEDADALSRVQAEAKGLLLTVVPPPPDVMVGGEREQVSQVLANLLSNAVKFTPPGGEVTLTCECDGNVARLRVHDTGVGIPPEALERAFEPFVQLDTGLTRRTEGAGLGLAISRRLARLMGGEVIAESTIGVGSTFTLTLRRQGTN